MTEKKPKKAPRKKKPKEPESLEAPQEEDPVEKWKTLGEASTRLANPTPRTDTERPGHFWPEGVPMPSRHYVRRAQPCPGCKRVNMPDGSQATRVNGTRDGVAYFFCKDCGHRWVLPTGETPLD